ncbi:MAG: hypothetical protein IH820_05540 [Bacteroidetes bacterium]|nr:hypothetical protein [Bacteroidota bacterium]
MYRFLVARLVVGVICVLGTGCDSTSIQPDITDVPLPTAINPANFVAGVAIPNPLFPLVPGTSRRVVGQTADGEEVILVEVTDQTKEILGVMTTVVRDRIWLEGILIEDTFDWYAQDNDGNVWYFGEDAKEIEHGHVVSTAGSWQAGVDGARAGIIMWAQPKVGSIYYQEYYEGEAEDIGEVLSLNETITVPFGRFEGCLKTEETTQLEPDVLEHKYYCPGLGHALTLDMEDGGTRYELIAVEGD